MSYPSQAYIYLPSEASLKNIHFKVDNFITACLSSAKCESLFQNEMSTFAYVK